MVIRARPLVRLDPRSLVPTGWDPREDLPLRAVLHQPVWGLVIQTPSRARASWRSSPCSPLRHAVVASRLASSAFTVFLVPHSRLARSRSVLVGHLLAIPAGLAVGHFLARSLWLRELGFGLSVVAVGLLMEAAGTALGLAIAPELPLAASVVVGAAVLSLTHRLLAPRRLDLREVPGIGSG